MLRLFDSDEQESMILRAFTSPEWTTSKLTAAEDEVEGGPAQPAVVEGTAEEAVFLMKKRALSPKTLTPRQQPVQSLLTTLYVGHAAKRGTAPTFTQIKRVHFAAAEDNVTVFLTRTVSDSALNNSSQEPGERTTSVFLSNVSGCGDAVLILDTQSGIHLIRNPGIMTKPVPDNRAGNYEGHGHN